MSAESPLHPASIEALVDLVASWHERGYFVRDPSPAVLRHDAAGSLTISESDTEKRSFGDLPQPSLAQLWALMPNRSVDDKMAAARQYSARRGLDVDLHAALRMFTENWLERCFHENRDFKVVQAGGMRWYARRGAFREAHQPVLNDPDRFLVPSSKLLKDGVTTTVAKAPGEALLKRFNLKKYRSLVKHHFTPSRARAAFQRAIHLEMHGIETPRPIAFAERRVFGWIYRTYLLTEFRPDAEEVDRVCREGSWPSELVKLRAVRSVGRLIGLLHAAGFANRDLKARNVLLSTTGEACLIDLDGLRAGERVNEDTRIKNLRRMIRDLVPFATLGVRDRLRFLRAYAAAFGKGRAGHYFRKLAEEPW